MILWRGTHDVGDLQRQSLFARIHNSYIMYHHYKSKSDGVEVKRHYNYVFLLTQWIRRYTSQAEYSCHSLEKHNIYSVLLTRPTRRRSLEKSVLLFLSRHREPYFGRGCLSSDCINFSSQYLCSALLTRPTCRRSLEESVLLFLSRHHEPYFRAWLLCFI